MLSVAPKIKKTVTPQYEPCRCRRGTSLSTRFQRRVQCIYSVLMSTPVFLRVFRVEQMHLNAVYRKKNSTVINYRTVSYVCMQRNEKYFNEFARDAFEENG